MTELNEEQIKALGEEIEKHHVGLRTKTRHRLIGFRCSCGKTFEYYHPDFLNHLKETES